MIAYYNEIDPQGAASLRELIREGIIAPGDVDERSIEDVRPSDLAGYVQCHFFAGIGVWSYSLRCAGWPDDRPVWTGSCPCQPFSAAGKGEGFADERHLWPSFFHLARVRRPVALFGEQVSSKDGLAWFNHVRSDLEGEGYTVGVSDTCAAGFGAPHLRQRLYFVGALDFTERIRDGGIPGIEGRKEQETPGCGEDEGGGVLQARYVGATLFVADAPNSHGRPGERGAETGTREDGERRGGSASGGIVGVVVHALQPGLEGHAGDERNGNEPGRQRKDEARPVATASEVGCMADPIRRRCWPEGEPGGLPTEIPGRRANESLPTEITGPCNGFWGNAEWIPCRDGKMRPIEPGTFPLAHGAAERVGRLHGYGNAIVAPVAEAFVRAYMEEER